MLVDKQSEVMSDLLFTVHQQGGDDVTWKPPILSDDDINSGRHAHRVSRFPLQTEQQILRDNFKQKNLFFGKLLNFTIHLFDNRYLKIGLQDNDEYKIKWTQDKVW